MSSVVGDHHVGPHPHIKEGSPHHGRVQGRDLPPDVGLQLCKVVRPGRIDAGLEITPKKEIQGIQVRTAGRPVSTSDTLPRHHSGTELTVQIDQVGSADVAGGSVLGPVKPVKEGNMR